MNKGLEFKIKEMAQRIKTLREIMGYSVEEMATKTGVSVEEYASCEMGEQDLNFAFLYRCADALKVDVTEIIDGTGPRLAGYTVTRVGDGQQIQKAHHFTLFLIMMKVYKTNLSKLQATMVKNVIS